MDQTITGLKKSRGGIRSHIPHHVKALEDAIKDLDQKFIKLSLAHLEDKWKREDEKSDQLLRIFEADPKYDADLDKEIADAEKAPTERTRYRYESNEALEEMTKAQGAAAAAASPAPGPQQQLPIIPPTIQLIAPPTQPSITSSYRLPSLELRHFNGNTFEWMEFWDSFSAAVHDQQGLSDIQKFTYLKSLLEGSAAASISDLTLTSANYGEAITTLEERFGKKEVLVSAHMSGLLHQSNPSMNYRPSEASWIRLRPIYVD